MQCSACATYSLRSFLNALINVELQVTRPNLPSKQFAVSRRRIHNSPHTHLVASSPNDEHKGILRQANSTELENNYLPIDNELFKPLQLRRNMTDTQLKRTSLPSVLRASVRAIHDSDHARKEYTLRLRSEVSARGEPQTAAWQGRSSTARIEGWQSTTKKLTGRDSETDTATLDSLGAASVLDSTNGFAQEDLDVKHRAKGLINSSGDVAEIHSKTCDSNGGLGPKIRPQSKNTELASNTGRPKSSEDFQLRTRNEHHQREPWQNQKTALRAKFGPSGWSPRKRLSPDALEGIRALHAQYPNKYTTPVLAGQFQISPEAVRRILKSKWRANEEEEEERRQRWDKRGAAIWSKMVEIGIKPPKKWRDMGIGRGRNRLREGRRDASKASTWENCNGSAVMREIGSGATLSDRIL